ncbi:hypothetical protein [Pararhizobium gei]|uniref:hypothetical protein n=1 Tax=Pararhizobium gei TaxID=1395951 RepID=UPI0023DA06C4|nr:hypothetical protein [Rhizobium gei]
MDVPSCRSKQMIKDAVFEGAIPGGIPSAAAPPFPLHRHVRRKSLIKDAVFRKDLFKSTGFGEDHRILEDKVDPHRRAPCADRNSTWSADAAGKIGFTLCHFDLFGPPPHDPSGRASTRIQRSSMAAERTAGICTAQCFALS